MAHSDERNAVFNVASLFTGCGGMDLGFRGGFRFLGRWYPRNPFKIVFANDTMLEACETYKSYFNKEVLREDITKVLDEKPHLIPDCDVITGGFPCQDFSASGKRGGARTKRGRLYTQMVRAVNLRKPLAFVAENVERLKQVSTIKTVLKRFEKAGDGYDVSVHTLVAADFGVPQLRRRIFIVGTRRDLDRDYVSPSPTHSEDGAESLEKWVSSKEALDDIHKRKRGIPNLNQRSGAIYYNVDWKFGNTFISASKPAPTIRAHHRGHIQFHYRGERRLSVRECARLQSFPDDFAFSSTMLKNYVLVGNAVPPVLAWHVARGLAGILRVENGERS